MNADQGFRRAPAKASDLAVGQIAISAALLLFTQVFSASLNRPYSP
jgi:hypothetical protein